MHFLNANLIPQLKISQKSMSHLIASKTSSTYVQKWFHNYCKSQASDIMENKKMFHFSIILLFLTIVQKWIWVVSIGVILTFKVIFDPLEYISLYLLFKHTCHQFLQYFILYQLWIKFNMQSTITRQTYCPEMIFCLDSAPMCYKLINFT